MNQTQRATLARSVLSRPRRVTVRIGGWQHPALPERPGLATDPHGVPLFSVAPGSMFAAAAMEAAVVSIEVLSGVGRPGSPEREARLHLEGTLQHRGACRCCDDQAIVAVQLRTVRVHTDEWRPVGLEHFHDPKHVLNPGFLEQMTEHANLAHQDELRESVAAAMGFDPSSLLAASLDRLDPFGVDVTWVDADGASTRHLTFATVVRTPDELGEALRTHLHPDLC